MTRNTGKQRSVEMPSIENRRTEDTAIDVANVVAGVALALSPWLFGYTANAAASWNAWVVGVIIAIVAIGALVSFRQWEEWINLALGAWAVISPWVLGFSAVAAATYAHVVLGLIVLVLAAAELWLVYRRTTSHV
jgi:uncharacterized membrane protein